MICLNLSLDRRYWLAIRYNGSRFPECSGVGIFHAQIAFRRASEPRRDYLLLAHLIRVGFLLAEISNIHDTARLGATFSDLETEGNDGDQKT
ncbi:protein of unknown function [Methylocaldum szegediense]|uniref:Uncharacterized protein n=1 Tax=Methylocaldum szegediense TaxID=73780 RepID=A0ABN8X1V2_9GAMM|nr:protein of unknown function [Methylocaldum szegediense]